MLHGLAGVFAVQLGRRPAGAHTLERWGRAQRKIVVVSGSQARNSRGSSRQNWVDRIFDIASTVSRRTALWGPEDGRHQAPVKAADLFAHSHFAKTIFRTRIGLPRNPQAGRVERKRASAPFQGLPTLILHALDMCNLAPFPHKRSFREKKLWRFRCDNIF